MFNVTEEEFEAMVEAAYDTIPDEFLELLDNVIITIADEPDEECIEASDDQNSLLFDNEILGFYDGVSLYERGGDYGSFEMPDVITIFKGPHERSFNSREEIAEEVRKTLVHEIGHHLGHDDETLYSMGY